MKALTKIFLTGLVTVLPVFATFYLVYWLTISVESTFGSMLKLVFGERFYLPGLGIALGVIMIFIVGIVMRSWFAQIIFRIWEDFLLRLPVIKSVYSTLQDFLDFFTRPKQGTGNQVVSVQLPGTNMRLLGFVTRSDLTRLPEGLRSDGEVAVYLPMSYQMGGYTVLIPREDIEPVDMSMEDAMRFAITAGVSASSRK